MEYQIRALEKKDLIQVSALEQQIFSDPWSLQSLEGALRRKENIYIAAERDSRIIGYCGLWGVPPEGNIYNVAVAPEYRRKRIGEALLLELLNRGRRAGITEFTLEVRKNNQPARNLYQKLGFESAGIRKNFYDHPKEDAIIMTLVRSAERA